MIDAKDEQDLRELQAELLATESSPWQPRCVARTFRFAPEPFAFTLQAWIELDAAESPFLLGRQPEAETALSEFEAAFRAFGHVETTPENCEPEDLVLLGWKIIGSIQRGFAMRVKLTPPEGSKAGSNVDNGLGSWLSILACLKSQLHFSMAEALSLKVGQAFALIAAHRCNEGWNVAAEAYALRDLEGTE